MILVIMLQPIIPQAYAICFGNGNLWVAINLQDANIYGDLACMQTAS